MNGNNAVAGGYAEEEAAYEAAIVEHSQKTGSDSIFPGRNYRGLVQYLSKRSTANSETVSSSFVRPPSRSGQVKSRIDSFLVHVELGGEESWFQDSIEDKKLFQDLPLPQIGKGQLLFMRGLPSPQWLKTIGAKYGVDPEFYQRHLQFPEDISGDRGHFCNPSLPSASTNTFQLKIPTICSRETVAPTTTPEDLETVRREALADTKRYHQGLGMSGLVGDSVVRKYLILSRQYYVIEQQISIHICNAGAGWIALIWSDNGRDLSRCEASPRPWLPVPGTKPWMTVYFPVIQNCPKVVDRSKRSEAMTPTPRRSSSSQTWETAQNGSLLPFGYGNSLDTRTAQSDPLYALSEVLRFVAFAEVQFLNAIKGRIEHELQFTEYWDRTNSLHNLQYLKSELGDHISNLIEVIAVLDLHAAHDWPDSTDKKVKDAANKKAKSLCLDFNHLLARAEQLSVACSEGIATMISASVISENKQAMRSAESVRKLTALASLYIPLSFASGFFGMNFKELVDLSVWVWFLMSAALLLSTFALYKLDLSRLL